MALEAPLQGHRQGERAPGHQHVGRTEDKGLTPAEGQPAPLPFRGEGHLGPHPFTGRRVGLGDRLQGPVALAGAGGEPREGLLRGARLGWVGDVDRDQLELAGSQRPGLVDADRVDRRQGFGRAHLLDQRVEPGEPHSGDGERDAHQQDQPLGDQRDQPGGSGLRGFVEGRVARLQGDDQHDRERDHQPGARLEHQVDLVLQRRGGVAEGTRLARDLLGVAVLTNRVHLVVAGPGDAERTRERPVADPLADTVGLTGEHGLVEGQPAALRHLAVRHQLVSRLDSDPVAGHDLVGTQLDQLAIPDDPRLRGHQQGEAVERLLGLQLLPDADVAVDHRDEAEESVGKQAEREHDDEEDADDQVEEA